MDSTILNLYNHFKNHPIISTDSRTVKVNSIFFALKGENFNGNKYAEEALAKGAYLAVIDEPGYDKGNKYLLTANALKTLQELAKYHRQRLNIPFIGITGTNGKTTTKELVNSILQKKFKTVSTSGNLNNHIGVPLTLLSCNSNTEIAIIELGANHPGEIADLCDIAQPGFGIITNIGLAHIEGFGSFDNIVKTKKALYDYIREKKGLVFVNKNNSLLTELSENISRIFYGTDDTCDTYGKLIQNSPFLKVEITTNSKLQTSNSKLPSTINYQLSTKLVGAYNFENILASVCIGSYFGVSLSDIKSAIENFMPSGYRSQFIETKANKVIMDAYNANPTSMVAAINNFASLNFENKIAIIGDMFELGNAAAIEHKKIIELLKKQDFEETFFIGPEFSAALKSYKSYKSYKSFKSTDAATDYFRTHPLFSKTILVKGSRGIKLEKIMDTF